MWAIICIPSVLIKWKGEVDGVKDVTKAFERDFRRNRTFRMRIRWWWRGMQGIQIVEKSNAPFDFNDGLDEMLRSYEESEQSRQ